MNARATLRSPTTLERLRTPILAHALALALAVGLHSTPFIPGVATFVRHLFERSAPIDRTETEVSIDLDITDEKVEPEKPQKEDAPPPVAPPPSEPEVETRPSPDTFVVPKPTPTVPETKPTAPPAPTPPPITPPPKTDATPKYVPEINEVGIAANPSGNPNNVIIIIVGKTLRNHPVGEKMGAMLPGIGQWRDFFGGTGIDAVKDVDLMVLQGPQLTISDRVDTVLLFSKPMSEIEESVKKIIERLGGTWLEGTAIPAATAKADKHERLFILDKSKKALYVTYPPGPTGKDEKWEPEKLAEEIKAKVKKFADLPAPTATPPFAIKMMVTDPGKFGRAPVIGQFIPTTMKRLTFQVDALTEGRAKLHIELWDKDEATAAGDLDDLNAKWGQIQLAALLKGLDIPNATFKNEGALVKAEFDVDKDFLDTFFELGQEQIEKEAKSSKR